MSAHPPSPYPAPARKPPPRKLWYVVGGVLLALALAAFAVGLLLTLRGATSTDATFSTADGMVAVESPPGETRMLYHPSSQEDGASCRVYEDDAEISVDEPFGTTTVGTGGEEWVGFGTFESGSGELSIQCLDSGSPVDIRVGDPLGADFVVGLLVTILLPMVLGLAGLVTLIVTAVLRSQRTGPRWAG